MHARVWMCSHVLAANARAYGRGPTGLAMPCCLRAPQAAVATPISVAMTGGHSPHAPSTPVEEVIGLMLSPQPQPGVGLGAGAQGFVPQQLLFGADAAGGQQGGSAGAASVAQMGPSLGGVYGMGRQESSSDDEVDVASLGFTPLALSACQPATSPMQVRGARAGKTCARDSPGLASICARGTTAEGGTLHAT